MWTRALRAFAVVVPAAALGVASAAHAQQDNYNPEVLSTTIVFCAPSPGNIDIAALAPDLVVTVDGVVPGSNVHIVIDFDNDGVDIVDDQLADGTGFLNVSYPMPDTTADFTVTISGFVPSSIPGDPDTFPFTNVLHGDRTECPDLPNTGGNAFPIGKTALGITLAGALLAAVAIRRRPRDEEPEEALVG